MAEQRRAARHRKYSPLYCDFARERYMRGDTHAKVAKLLDVVPETIMRWTREHEEYRRAFHEGRRAAPSYRLSQMPMHAPLFPPAETPGAAGAPDRPDSEPITKVERIFVKSPFSNR